MEIPFVDLKIQYRNLKTEIDAAMAAVIADAAFIGTKANSYVQAFEVAFASFSGVKHCIGCANGTDALEILLKAAGLGPGDEVLVPSVSWIASSEAASNIGARPVFVDIDPQTYSLDPARMAEKITDRTRAVIPVHLYGLPADMDPIMALARKHDLFVLEDCAQAHGALYKGQPVGTIGHCGSFSLFPGKNLGAYGDAGCMITNDDALAEKARMIGQHGQAGKKFDHMVEGRNSRLDGLQAAILSVKLPHLQDWTRLRIAHADTYRKLLAGAPFSLPSCPEDRRPVYHQFVLQADERDALRAGLDAAGIATGIQYPIALPLLEAYADRGHTPEQFPVGYQLTQRVLTLPIFPELTAAQIRYVCDHLMAGV